jgi:hypothetical protein
VMWCSCTAGTVGCAAQLPSCPGLKTHGLHDIAIVSVKWWDGR